MASITTWTRLEPRPRGDDLTPSLEGRVYDPAWLLGRQWQVGEFVGDDAGTPIDVRLEVETQPIVAWRSAGQVGAFDPDVPLDCLVGAEERGAASFAERAEAGIELLELLAEAGCSPEGVRALIGTQLLTAPAAGTTTGEGTALLALAAGRVPDGDALAPEMESIASSGQVPQEMGLSADDARAVVAAARNWIAWRASLVRTAPASSWINEQIEYRFDLGVQPSAAPAYTLSAPSWDGDRLDWYDVDVDHRVTPPARMVGSPAVQGGTLRAKGLPAPLTYPGMPAARWWQFEDARVNFAQISAAPEDLARMLVVEFASVYSNDWYLWPLDLPIGAVHRITKLEVVNTFGDTVEIGAASASAGGSSTADWQLFRPTERSQTGAASAYDGLVLLPTLVSPLEGEVFEEVRLLRDELANLAWAIEATVRGEDGLPLDRHTAAAVSGGLPAQEQQVHAKDTGPLEYRLETEVPVYWFPLSPDDGGAPTFHLLLVRRLDDTGQVHDAVPLGKVLSPGFWLWQEEVPREGARVIRRHRMARAGDGRLYTWSARRSETGRGEGSSGLRYDDAIPVVEEAVR